MAGTIWGTRALTPVLTVSMKSGLDGRNNASVTTVVVIVAAVSMKSGLDGRNNEGAGGHGHTSIHWSQ